MDEITRRIPVNGTIPDLVVRQYDNLSRIVTVQIEDSGGNPLDLTGCKARLYVERSVETVTLADTDLLACEIPDAVGGVVRFDIYNGLTYRPGTYWCELRVTRAADDAALSLSPFVLRVTETIRTDDLLEGNAQYTALAESLRVVDNWRSPCCVSFGAVAEMLRCAQSYFDYAYTDNGEPSGLLYESHHGLYSDNLGDGAANGVFGIVCSSFVDAILNGVTFQNSRYAGNDANLGYAWGVVFDDTGDFGTIYDGQTDTDAAALVHHRYLSSQYLAKYAKNHGLLFPIDSAHRVRPGDVLFSGDVEGRYLGIDHVAIVVNASQTHVSVIEAWDGAVRADGNPVGLRINKRALHWFTHGATFPLGDTYYRPMMIEYGMDIALTAGPAASPVTYSKLYQFTTEIAKGFHTIVIHGQLSSTPFVMTTYTGASAAASHGSMHKVGDDYYLTFYAQQPGTVSLLIADDGGDYSASEIALYCGYADISTATADMTERMPLL